MADRNLFAVAAPAAGREMRLGDAATGLVLGTGFALAYGMAALPLGRLADRGWRRVLLIAGVLAWTVGSAATGLCRTLSTLLAARMLIGLGQAAFAPAALALLVEAPLPSRAARLAAYTVGSTVGRGGALLGGGAVLGVLAGMALGWRWLFEVTALPNIVIATLLLLRRDLGGEPIDVAPVPAGPRLPLALYLIAAAAPLAAGQALIGWTPSLMVRQHGGTAAAAGVMLGAVALVAAPAGQLLGGWLGRRWAVMRDGPAAVIAGALWLSVPAVLLIAIAPRGGVALVGVAAANVTVGIGSYAALFGWQELTPPAARGVANGLFMAVVTLAGAGLGPLVTGALSQWGPGGLGSALLIVTVATAVVASGAAVLLAGRRHDPAWSATA